MIFSVVMQVQDILGNSIQRVVNEARDATEQARKQAEEEEKRRFHGTPVNDGTFYAWKKKFDKEMFALKAKEKAALEAAMSKKPTGKELFLKDESLVDSDLAIGGAAAGIAEDDNVADSDDENCEAPDLLPDMAVDD